MEQSQVWLYITKKENYATCAGDQSKTSVANKQSSSLYLVFACDQINRLLKHLTNYRNINKSVIPATPVFKRAFRTKIILVDFLSKSFENQLHQILAFYDHPFSKYDNANFLLERLFSLKILPGLPTKNKTFQKFVYVCNSHWPVSAVLLWKKSKGSKL